VIHNPGTVTGLWMNKHKGNGVLISPSPFIDQEVPQAVDGVGIILANSAVESDIAMNFVASRARKL